MCSQVKPWNEKLTDLATQSHLNV